MTDDDKSRDAIYIDALHELANEQADRIEKLEAANLKQSLITVDHLSRIEKLNAALREMLDIVATHRVYVGNSPAGELACEWTMDALKEIHAKMEEVLDRAALAGEKKDD